jgi:N,N-dimethylformamidase
MLGIVGYPDRISVAPAETIGFCVSCAAGIDRYAAEIVRLYSGDPDPAGPGHREEPVPTPVAGEYPGRAQVIRAGSYAVIEDHPALALESFEISALIWPTRLAAGRQGIVTKWSANSAAGYALVIDADGEVALLLGDGDGGIARIGTATPLLERCWFAVSATLDVSTGTATVSQAPVVSATNGPASPLLPADRLTASVRRTVTIRPARTDVPLGLAAWPLYNGKLERPRIRAGERVIADWDFAAEITHAGVRPLDRITDRSPNELHGTAVNTPTRAMTGHNWTGREHRFTNAPEEYGAIHFHDDDLDDAGWTPDFRLEVPADLPSGVYAAKLSGAGHEDYVPFYVRPPRDRATARIGLLVPTNSYLAYANDNVAIDDATQELATGRTAILSRHALHLNEHREYGGSLYDLHGDGSGTCHASWRRPVLTMRPKYRHTYARAWQFTADLHLVDWLDAKGFAVDVFTDEDLEREGADLLRRYRAVLTGSHPEYASAGMLDAIAAYLGSGGRLAYLGGNGFYWAVAFHPDRPHMLEIRRTGGTGNWSADPGECHLSVTGELGGIWRHLGRAPQKLVGVGFVAQGLDRSTYYRRLPDSFDPDVAWIFDGVDADAPLGDFGLAGGGASGLEVDWYDPALGSPPHAFLLASSEGHTSVVCEVRENVGGTVAGLGGDENPNVRNDLVYFTTPYGGAVFSTGSIAWCASLSHDGYDNAVSRITENVIRGFAAD